ncbi:hypothetical protein [Mycobacterium intracellulare]|uniref:hypothetical protein n=1 Tax=Mycobacterium intracellulare TaxID=1767 RepID=UPI00044EFC14|nr:hypothetical protein [Mycobacterium intracellulare]ETZ33167.1 hypothetical protein L843_3653 [Mycobacterium intracellulare MIN_061107_1834]MCA2273606.1 hypothetical protein [Mycobacterium intracellulare]MCA2325727.1 hypothetical protein [Mycobacterium intracellulare]UEB26558.1 hypothetical protein LK403_10465 [Mycobacterium intracellulare]WVL05526.1 hypothetical protein KN247_25940 [Mycobacterium intracellulare]
MTDNARGFPVSLAGVEVSDIDLDAEDFVFQGERMTDERAAQIAQTVFEKSTGPGVADESL